MPTNSLIGLAVDVLSTSIFSNLGRWAPAFKFFSRAPCIVWLIQMLNKINKIHRNHMDIYFYARASHRATTFRHNSFGNCELVNRLADASRISSRSRLVVSTRNDSNIVIPASRVPAKVVFKRSSRPNVHAIEFWQRNLRCLLRAGRAPQNNRSGKTTSAAVNHCGVC